MQKAAATPSLSNQGKLKNGGEWILNFFLGGGGINHTLDTQSLYG
jgi:hypothetical protein